MLFKRFLSVNMLSFNNLGNPSTIIYSKLWERSQVKWQNKRTLNLPLFGSTSRIYPQGGRETQKVGDIYIVSEVTQSCLTLCDTVDCSLPGSSLQGIDSPGKSTGVGCHFLLQGTFPTQGLTPGLLHSRQML